MIPNKRSRSQRKPAPSALHHRTWRLPRLEMSVPAVSAVRRCKSMESPEHERRRVVDYLKSQAPDLAVEHTEKVAGEWVFDREYEVWDVHTRAEGPGRPRRERWWVVTNPTNLYNQSDFKSMDYTLSFHIGVTTRVFAQQALKAPNRPEPRLERTRRQWEQAAEAAQRAEEAEEFQSVGVRCRETLVSFVHALGTKEIVPTGQEAPKKSDFIHWSERLADAVAPGDSNSELRGYLKAVAKLTWQYVGWLTHAKNAVRLDSDLAVEMVGHLLSVFEQAVERQERGGPDRCPSCESYRVVGDWEFDADGEVMLHRRLCEACSWSEDYEPEPLRAPSPPPAAPEGECMTGSMGPGLPPSLPVKKAAPPRGRPKPR
jgi:hypothetical protein